MRGVFGFINKRWYVLLIIGIGIAIFLVNQQNVAAKKEKENRFTIKRENLEETLSLSGAVDADEHVILRFQTSGRLAWVGVKEGDMVKKYQTIATLDQRDVKKRLEKSLNDFAKERRDFDQSKDDNQRVGDQPIREDGDRMKRILENAQWDLNSSVIDVELSTLSVEYANLWTPIAGRVIRVDTKFSGVNVTPAGSEFEIVNPDTLYFSFTADQTEIIRLKEGMQGDLILDSFPDSTVKGIIEYISYTPKQGETGTVYEGRVNLKNEYTPQLRLGMTGDISFTLQKRNQVLVIPSNYVQKDAKGSYVNLINSDGKETKTYIKVASEIDGNFEILKGLQEGDMIRIPKSN